MSPADLTDSVGDSVSWIYPDPVFVRLCLCVFKLNPSFLRISSSAAIDILVCRSFATTREKPSSSAGFRPTSSAGGNATSTTLQLKVNSSVG